MVNYLGDIKGDQFTLYKTETYPLNGNVSGYGNKIPTEYMVKFFNRRYRVYAICWSNCASFYIEMKGVRYFIHDYDLDNMKA